MKIMKAYAFASIRIILCIVANFVLYSNTSEFGTYILFGIYQICQILKCFFRAQKVEHKP